MLRARSEAIRSFDNLRDRVRRFLKSERYGRPEVADFIDQMSETHQVFLFGGILRDLSLVGNEGFNSDVDIVVVPTNGAGGKSPLDDHQTVMNKFGGFRITLSRWKIDVWELKNTWAFAKGYSQPSVQNLCNATFFDWDAIAFDVQNGHIYALSDYLARINNRLLDINLEPSPNPLGNVVKAFRYCERYDAALSSRLAHYVYVHASNVKAESICEYESRVSAHPVLTPAIVEDVLSDLREHDVAARSVPFRKRRVQEELWS